MKKRVVSLLMICALSVGMLAGCGSSETQNQATGSADNQPEPRRWQRPRPRRQPTTQILLQLSRSSNRQKE